MCAIDALIGSGFAILGLTVVMIIYKRLNRREIDYPKLPPGVGDDKKI